MVSWICIFKWGTKGPETMATTLNTEHKWKNRMPRRYRQISHLCIFYLVMLTIISNLKWNCNRSRTIRAVSWIGQQIQSNSIQFNSIKSNEMKLNPSLDEMKFKISGISRIANEHSFVSHVHLWQTNLITMASQPPRPPNQFWSMGYSSLISSMLMFSFIDGFGAMNV